jgi:hypothetical protein
MEKKDFDVILLGPVLVERAGLKLQKKGNHRSQKRRHFLV